jgi:serine/threonine protein kinase
VLAFEIMEGGDLHSFMKRRGRTHAEQRLCSRDARLVFSQLINAVSFAHSQCIIHRDLKLENVLLKENGLEQVKIADFGLSAYYRPGSLQKVHCGTLTFLAPEAFGEAANAGPPLDVWSLGVILFTMLCGRLPFDDVDHVGEEGRKGKKRRSHSVIQAKISKGQYRMENDLLPEEKDIIRMFLTVDPNSRCSLPEALNHQWMKMFLPDVDILANPANVTAEVGVADASPTPGVDSVGSTPTNASMPHTPPSFATGAGVMSPPTTIPENSVLELLGQPDDASSSYKVRTPPSEMRSEKRRSAVEDESGVHLLHGVHSCESGNSGSVVSSSLKSSSNADECEIVSAHDNSFDENAKSAKEILSDDEMNESEHLCSVTDNDVVAPLPILDALDENKNLHTAASDPALSHSTTFKLHRLRKSATADSIVNNDSDNDNFIDSVDDDDLEFHDNLKKTIDSLFPSIPIVSAAPAGPAGNAGRSPATSASATRRDARPKRRSGSENGTDSTAGTRRGKGT